MPQTRNSVSGDVTGTTTSTGGSSNLVTAVLDQKVLDALIKALTPVITTVIERCLDEKLKALLGDVTKVKALAEATEVRTTALEGALKKANEQITKMKAQIEDMDSYSKRDNLIIHGLKIQSFADAASVPAMGQQTQSTRPLDGNVASVSDAVVELCQQQLGLNITLADISVAHRLGPSARPNSASARPPSSAVIVRFTSRRARDQVYAARKQLKVLRNSVYINEHLSSETSVLFKEARALVKGKMLHSAWTFNGHVYVKADESLTTRPKRITEMSQLQ